MRVAAKPIAMSPVPRQGQPEGWPFSVGRGQQRQRRASLQAGLYVGVAVLALTIACATNPVTGKREISLMSEAQEIAMGQAADADVRREMGDLRQPRAAALRLRHRLQARQALASSQPALAVRGRRSSGGQRVRAAGRLHLHHARHPAVPERRSRAGRRARPRDRSRHRAPLGAAGDAAASSGRPR